MPHINCSIAALHDLAEIDWNALLRFFLIAIAAGSILTVLLAAWILRSVRRISLPPDADFFTALRATPLTVVLMLDLLDFSLDFLSAPIAWPLLGRLGLTPLRQVTVIEELIPGTQVIPTMSLAWLAARIIRRG
jgi:hypothetical protein